MEYINNKRSFSFSDVESLNQYKTRSPYSETADPIQMLTVYRRGDVEKRYA